MNQEFKKEWVAALRSGEYEQTDGTLRSSDNKYCCLGVACEVLGVKWVASNPSGPDFSTYGASFVGGDPIWGSLPDAVRDQIDLSREAESHLIELNDEARKNFNEIADYIETF